MKRSKMIYDTGKGKKSKESRRIPTELLLKKG